jgi:MFS family permease
MQAVGWGIYNSFGVFFNPIMNTFGWQRAAISGAVSLSMLIYGLASILLGRLNDRVGPKLIMTASGILLGAGYLLMSRIDALWQLYLIYGVIVGVGLSGTDVVLLSTVARWFARLRGRMSGTLKVGTGVGMLIFPLISHWLTARYNWQTAVAVLGVLILSLFLVLSQLLVRDPASRGLSPDGDGQIDMGMAAVAEEGPAFLEAFRSTQVWMICAAYFILTICTMTILLHIVPHAIDLGVAKVDAARVLATIGAVSIAGRFFMGFVSDKTGNRRSLAICFCLLMASLLWLLVAGRLWMLFVFALFYGFAHGGFFAVMSPLVAESFGTFSHGAILGLVIFASAFGGSVGPLMAGLIYDVTGSYRIVFWALPAISLLGLTVALRLKPPRLPGTQPPPV